MSDQVHERGTSLLLLGKSKEAKCALTVNLWTEMRYAK